MRGELVVRSIHETTGAFDFEAACACRLCESVACGCAQTALRKDREAKGEKERRLGAPDELVKDGHEDARFLFVAAKGHRLRLRSANGPHVLPVVFHRRDQHPLRSADGADGEQLALADAVVDGPPGHAQNFSGLIDGDAAAKLLFEHPTPPELPTAMAKSVPETL
jgi:hypothetical protein